MRLAKENRQMVQDDVDGWEKALGCGKRAGSDREDV